MQQENTQFEILNKVDVGGMAEIFRAKNLSTGEIIAIKRILPSLIGQGDFINMFIDEAAICKLLHHPNIVRVDQIGLMDQSLFLAMEYVEGTNLRELLNFASQYNYKIPTHEAVRIAILVLDGLEYAHHLCDENGEPLNLIHRDVSPPNILLGLNGDVKLTDFGLVKSKAQISHTVPGLIKGKFSYLSPEAAYGESIDLRSDIYAVGIILWEMLTARPLFSDPVEMKILDLVRKSIVPPIAPINPDVPPELEAIVMKGLARNRSDRYKTAAEFAQALRDFLTSIGNPKSELGKIVAAIKQPPQAQDMNTSLSENSVRDTIPEHNNHHFKQDDIPTKENDVLIEDLLFDEDEARDTVQQSKIVTQTLSPINHSKPPVKHENSDIQTALPTIEIKDHNKKIFLILISAIIVVALILIYILAFLK